MAKILGVYEKIKCYENTRVSPRINCPDEYKDIDNVIINEDLTVRFEGTTQQCLDSSLF